MAFADEAVIVTAMPAASTLPTDESLRDFGISRLRQSSETRTIPPPLEWATRRGRARLFKDLRRIIRIIADVGVRGCILSTGFGLRRTPHCGVMDPSLRCKKVIVSLQLHLTSTPDSAIARGAETLT
jgi:hypothetical protein